MFIQEAPLYICDMFETTIVNNEARILRSTSSNNFIISKPNEELFKQSMLYSSTLFGVYCLST